jgi:hypothetical protein
LLLGGNLNGGNSYMPNATIANVNQMPTLPELVQMALKKSGGDEAAAAKLLDCDVTAVRAFAA